RRAPGRRWSSFARCSQDPTTSRPALRPDRSRRRRPGWSSSPSGAAAAPVHAEHRTPSRAAWCCTRIDDVCARARRGEMASAWRFAAGAGAAPCRKSLDVIWRDGGARIVPEPRGRAPFASAARALARHARRASRTSRYLDLALDGVTRVVRAYGAAQLSDAGRHFGHHGGLLAQGELALVEFRVADHELPGKLEVDVPVALGLDHHLAL